MSISADIDFMGFKEGQTEEQSGKTIHHLILQMPDFVVYLDEDLHVWWRFFKASLDLDKFAKVLNRVAMLESIPIQYMHVSNRLAFRRMVGEGVARFLANGCEESAKEVLDEAEKFVIGRNREVSRRWFLTVSLICFAMIATVCLTSWYYRKSLIPPFGLTAFQTAIACMFGGFGGVLSIFSRMQDIAVDPAAGKLLHTLETIARIIGAIIGACLVALALQSKFMLGDTKAAGVEFALMLMFCLVAGASERLVPSLIERVEKQNGGPPKT